MVETQLQDVTDYTDHNKLGATSYTFSLCTELSKPVNSEGGGSLAKTGKYAGSWSITV